MYSNFRQLILALPVLAAGCSTLSSVENYPVLKQTRPADTAMSCIAIAGDFRMASDLRAEILDAHGDAISGAIKDSAWGAVTNPAGAVANGVWTAAGATNETQVYARAAAAAGLRMEQLLRYKRDKDCAVTPTRDPSLTDDQILTLLDEILAQYEAGEIDEKEYIRQRANLLNKMRYLSSY